MGVKKCARAKANSIGMSTHGKNIGSRKVESETNGLPKWRLKANYLMRELARTWYGKDSALPFPVDLHQFERLLIEVIWQFVEDHGLRGKCVLEWLGEARREFEATHGREIKFKEWVDRFDWIIEAGIPILKWHEEFSRDEVIQDILRTIEWLIHYATDEKEKSEPPFPSAVWLKPIEYYETFASWPVLAPTPYWRLLMNDVERELAYVWYGRKPYNPDAIRDKLIKALFQYVWDMWGDKQEAYKRLREAEVEFESRHGVSLEFKTPAHEIVWAAKVCIPASFLQVEFLHDAQTRRVLRALRLIHILYQAGAPGPYSKYSVSFEDVCYYDNLLPSKFSWKYDED